MSKKTYAIKLNNVESCAEALDKRIKGGIAVLGTGDEEEVRHYFLWDKKEEGKTVVQ
jgi:hypothetical protein